MKKNQAQKFIVLFLFFLFAYQWRISSALPDHNYCFLNVCSSKQGQR